MEDKERGGGGTQGVEGDRGQGVADQDSNNNTGGPPNPTKVSLYAKRYMELGDVKGAEVTLMKAVDPFLMDGQKNDDHFLNVGDNLCVIYRNNLAVVKQSWMKRGCAEILFRDALDDGLKWTRNKENNNGNNGEANPLSPTFLKKLEREMKIIRYNLGLCWLMHPTYKRAAFSAVMYNVRLNPDDAKLWLHAAEAVLAFISTTKDVWKTDKFVFQIISTSFDLLASPDMWDEAEVEEDLHLASSYCPNTNKNDKMEPSLDLALRCLIHASRLLSNNNGLNNGLDQCLVAEEDVPTKMIPILINSAYILLRSKRFLETRTVSDEVYRSITASLKDRLLARCYSDIAKFHLGQADWEVFTPIRPDLVTPEECELSGMDYMEFTEFIKTLNMKRKYHEILALMSKPTNLQLATTRLELYIKENSTNLQRAFISLYMYLAFRVRVAANFTDLKVKYSKLHRQLHTLSPSYQHENQRKRASEQAQQMQIPTLVDLNNTQKLTWALISELLSLDKNPETEAESKPKKNTSPLVVLIRDEKMKSRGIRIPL